MDRLFVPEKKDYKMSYENIPTVIFSHPPIGTVGLTESEAKTKFGEDKVKVYRSKFTNMLYSLATDDKYKLPTLMKIVCSVDESGRETVVGFAGIGKSIDEMTQVLATLVVMKASKQDLDNTIAIHPTASEELVLMDAKFIM